MIKIYYVRGESERYAGEKIEKATFANESDAMIFWQALSEKRKKYLVMERNGEPVTEFRHTGWSDSPGYYVHAYALTRTLTDEERSRQIKQGYKFEPVRETTQ